MTNTDPNDTNQTPFEEALGQLQSIVRQLEAGSLGLEDSLRQFELGMKLIRECYITLENAEQRIQVLTGFNASGEAVMQPFHAAATISSGTSTVTSYASGEGSEPDNLDPKDKVRVPRRTRSPRRSRESQSPGFFGADDEG